MSDAKPKPRGPSSAPTNQDGVLELLPLLGNRVVLMHPSEESASHEGDFDVAVDGLDHLWPLRLPRGWRLLQALHYDTRGWYWVVEHDGKTIALDTIDDPEGLGRDGLPTDELVSLAEALPNAARAVYLTAKRIRKRSVDPGVWRDISSLALQDGALYHGTMSRVMGRAVASRLFRFVEAGRVPSARLLWSAKTSQWLRRRRTPRRIGLSGTTAVRRWFGRISRPAGLLVVILGPDGAGKTTVADALPGACAGPFRRSLRLHWRPGLLPRAGSLIGVPPGDPTRPHAARPHGRLTSIGTLVYYWVDFLLGSLIWIPAVKMRSGLVVADRWYWDLIVDPRRFRMSGSTTVARLLGSLLPHPDLVILLEAPTRVLASRKAELAPSELERQVVAYRALVASRRRVDLDAAKTVEELVSAARDAVFATLARRAAVRLGHGWAAVPSRMRARWILPRGPRSAAAAALSVYQPTSSRARLGWRAARTLGSLGWMRLAPRNVAIPEDVRELVTPYIPSRSTLAVMRANHENRFLVAIVGLDGRFHAVVKVATDERGAAALHVEADNIERFGPLLDQPLLPPRIVDRAPGVIVLEPVAWNVSRRPWVLDREVAFALGRAFGRSSQRGSGFAHGDVAPWNLLRTAAAWVLVDWESARGDAPPFFDVCHHFVQTHVLLGKPTFEELIDDQAGDGTLSRAVEAYAAGADIAGVSWRKSLTDYLEASLGQLDPGDDQGLAARQRLLHTLRR